MTTMNYIGLDVHKKTISYCVKDVSGRIQQEGKVGSLALYRRARVHSSHPRLEPLLITCLALEEFFPQS